MASEIILCVDDDPAVLNVLRTLLIETLGDDCLVEIAESGQEALEICAELQAEGREVSVVISDFIMPGMSGDELLVRLHTMSPHTIKIMLTGQSSLQGIHRAINEANLYRFLEKPINGADLVLTTKSAIHAYDQERELEQRNKELEERNAELKEANEELETRVAHRTEELETALSDLHRAQKEAVESEKLASLGRIVAGVAHELNTPLGNALTVASALNDRLQPMFEESKAGVYRRRTLDAIAEKGDEGMVLLLRNLEKAAKLISNFKQVAVDQTSEQRRRFDLAQVTEEVASMIRPAFRKTTHQLTLDLAPAISCDSFPGPYGQVITNLLMNTLAHAFDGKEEGQVSLRTELLGKASFRVTVEDNGCGMTEEVRKHVFDPFFTTRLGRGGSGLGMNIVQGFVTRVLHGRITIESSPGAGTRVMLDLPRQAPEYTN